MARVLIAADTWMRGVALGVQDYFLLGGRALRFAVSRPFYWRDVVTQMDRIGVGSVPIVLLTGLFTGMVLALQSSVELGKFGATLYIGNLVGASMVRELGPVLSSLAVAGRAGSGIAAELGAMRVTEQIDALYAMGRDPVPFLVVPRVLGGVLVFPALVVLANVAGMTAAWFVGILTVDGLTTADFVYGARFYFEPFDVWYSVIKGTLFGVAITFLACYIGLEGKGGAEGVGRTTTLATVVSTVAIMIIDVAVVPLLKLF